MNNELIRFGDLWDSVPSLFDYNFFRRIPTEDDLRHLNGKSDFEERDDKYVIDLEVPGVKKDQIDLSLKDDYLTVNWSQKNDKESENGRYERSSGDFSRKFYVNGIDSENVKAELKNGVLKIELKKNEKRKPKKISIN